jgi:hypothetical protein
MRISDISDWLNIMLHPGTIGIPSEDTNIFKFLL